MFARFPAQAVSCSFHYEHILGGQQEQKDISIAKYRCKVFQFLQILKSRFKA